MNGVIVNYRRGRKTMHSNQMIVEVEGINSKSETQKIMGKKAVWKTSSGKLMVGKVLAPHGGNGAVRVRFAKGLPGQAIGTKLEIKA